jgi:hypothetical protein
LYVWVFAWKTIVCVFKRMLAFLYGCVYAIGQEDVFIGLAVVFWHSCSVFGVCGGADNPTSVSSHWGTLGQGLGLVSLLSSNCWSWAFPSRQAKSSYRLTNPNHKYVCSTYFSMFFRCLLIVGCFNLFPSLNSSRGTNVPKAPYCNIVSLSLDRWFTSLWHDLTSMLLPVWCLGLLLPVWCLDL